MENIVVSGGFDNIGSRDVRFLEEAAKHGPVQVYLWSDQTVKMRTGMSPRFPQQEREYFLRAVRYVHKVWKGNETFDLDELPQVDGFKPGMWIVPSI